MTIKSEITESVDKSVRMRNKLSTLLHTTPGQDILVSKELLETLRQTLDTNANVLGRSFDLVVGEA